MFCESGFIFRKMRLDIADIAFFTRKAEDVRSAGSHGGATAVTSSYAPVAYMVLVTPPFQGAGSAAFNFACSTMAAVHGKKYIN